MFTSEDKTKFENLGISIEEINNQLTRLKTGFPKIKLVKPALLQKGIFTYEEREIKDNAKSYDKFKRDYKLAKFVPASGAGTRMFKDLVAYANITTDEQSGTISKDVENLMDNIPLLPCSKQLFAILESKGYNLNALLQSKDYKIISKTLIDAEGLHLAALPKALIPFHSYEDGERTAMEEHINEASHYCVQTDKKVNCHFTLLPDHVTMAENLINSIKSKYEKKYNITLNSTCFIQNPATDTIAIDEKGNPFRKEDDTILLRPGGHGALLENLNAMDAHIVFIRNIDNVAHERLLEKRALYKKALAGILIRHHRKISSFLHQLDRQRIKNDAFMMEVTYFLKNKLCFIPPDKFTKMNSEEKMEYLITVLNRPLRVCGVVKNEGEPGGGPFWVQNEDGSMALQIIEEAQIDRNDPEQKSILEQSTHFNPVDIVCFMEDMHGRKFDLKKYVNHDTGIITRKTYGNAKIKVLEHPGLWNGAMWHWNTVFVEMPIETFTPVKTINDFLRPAHQPE